MDDELLRQPDPEGYSEAKNADGLNQPEQLYLESLVKLSTNIPALKEKVVDRLKDPVEASVLFDDYNALLGKNPKVNLKAIEIIADKMNRLPSFVSLTGCQKIIQQRIPNERYEIRPEVVKVIHEMAPLIRAAATRLDASHKEGAEYPQNIADLLGIRRHSTESVVKNTIENLLNQIKQLKEEGSGYFTTAGVAELLVELTPLPEIQERMRLKTMKDGLVSESNKGDLTDGQLKTILLENSLATEGNTVTFFNLKHAVNDLKRISNRGYGRTVGVGEENTQQGLELEINAHLTTLLRGS